MSHNNTETNALDDNIDKTDQVTSNLGAHSAPHGSLQVQLFGIQDVAMDTTDDSEVKPIIIQPEDPKDIGIHAQTCDLHSQVDNRPLMQKEHAEISDRIKNGALKDFDKQFMTDVETMKQRSETVSVALAFRSSDKHGVNAMKSGDMKYEDTSEILHTDVKIELEFSNIMKYKVNNEKSETSNCESPETNEAFESIIECADFEDMSEFGTDIKIENEISYNQSDHDDKFITEFDTQNEVEPHVGESRRQNGSLNRSSCGKSKNTICKLCKKDLKSEAALKLQNRAREANKRHVCKICDLKFSDLQQLIIHMRCHVSTLFSYYPCGVCGRSYTTANELDSHAEDHKIGLGLKSKLWQTREETCVGTVAKQTANHRLDEHVVDLQTIERRFEFYKCSKCHKGFAQKHALRMHTKSCNREDKPVTCKVCCGVFPNVNELIHHMPIHGGDKTHFCHLCGEGYTDSQSLTDHFYKAHPDERCFNCDECDKKFAKKSLLNKHRQFHSKSRPYQCDTCKLRYMTKSSLETHMKFHSGETPFSCIECEKSFISKGLLNGHMRSKHSGPNKSTA